MIKLNQRKWTRLVLLSVMGCTMVTGTVQAQLQHKGTIVTRNRNYSGDIRWKAGTRVYQISAGNQTLEIPARDVVRVALAEQPAGLEQAIRMVQAGQAAAAIPALEKIRTSYVALGPDKIAAQYLSKAYLDMGQTSKAVALCEELIRDNPDAASDGKLLGVYVDALIKAEMYAKAERVLDDIIASSDRDAAAIAQVRRGDMFMARGEMKEALLSGYLRTIILFQNQKEVQPEALFKAIKCHTALNEHNYAEKWRKRLLAAYPNSKEARQLAN